MKKRLFSLLLAVLMIITVLPAMTLVTYADAVVHDHAYYEGLGLWVTAEQGSELTETQIARNHFADVCEAYNITFPDTFIPSAIGKDFYGAFASLNTTGASDTQIKNLQTVVTRISKYLEYPNLYVYNGFSFYFDFSNPDTYYFRKYKRDLTDLEKAQNHFADLVLCYDLTLPDSFIDENDYSKFSSFVLDNTTEGYKATIQAAIDNLLTLDDYAKYYVTDGLLAMMDLTNYQELARLVEQKPTLDATYSQSAFVKIPLGKYAGKYTKIAAEVNNLTDAATGGDFTFENGGLTSTFKILFCYIDFTRVWDNYYDGAQNLKSYTFIVNDYTPTSTSEVATKGYAIQTDFKAKTEGLSVSPQSPFILLDYFSDSDGQKQGQTSDQENMLVYSVLPVKKTDGSTVYLPYQFGYAFGHYTNLSELDAANTASDNLEIYNSLLYGDHLYYSSSAKYTSYNTGTGKTTFTPSSTVLYNGKYQTTGYQEVPKATLYDSKPNRYRFPVGTTYYVRHYCRDITADEIAQNHFADLMYYYKIDPAKIDSALALDSFDYRHFNQYEIANTTKGYKEKIEAQLTSGHVAEVVSTASTCTTHGVSHTECKLCGKELIAGSTLELLPHTPTDWAVKKAATYGENGIKIKTCSVCNTVLETEAIPALGYITLFLEKVDAVTSSTNNRAIFVAIPAAIEVYQNLSDTDKADPRAAEAVAKLNDAITAYNATAEKLNKETKAANQIALSAVAPIVIAISGIWYVLSKKAF